MKKKEWQKRRRPLYEKTLLFMTLPSRIKGRKSCENPNFHQKSGINVKGIDKAGFCVILSHDLNWDSVPKQD